MMSRKSRTNIDTAIRSASADKAKRIDTELKTRSFRSLTGGYLDYDIENMPCARIHLMSQASRDTNQIAHANRMDGPSVYRCATELILSNGFLLNDFPAERKLC